MSGSWIPNSCRSIVRIKPKHDDVDGFYELLGVSPSATDEEVKRAARDAMLKTHPDAGGDEDEFLRVHEAYETLSNPASRAAYDVKERVRGNGRVFVRVSENVPVPHNDEPPAFWKEPQSILGDDDIMLVREWQDMLLEAAWEFGAALPIKAGIGNCPSGYALVDGIAVIDRKAVPQRWAANVYILKGMIDDAKL